MGLFDSPWHILIVVVVLVLLFGSAKLPKAAKSLGEAMRIFKSEAQKLHDDGNKAQVDAATQQQLATQQAAVAAQAPLVTQQAPAHHEPAQDVRVHHQAPPPPVSDAPPPPPAGHHPG